MSWQGYIDSLMNTKTMTSVGIFGMDGTPWAISTGFPVTHYNAIYIYMKYNQHKFPNNLVDSG